MTDRQVFTGFTERAETIPLPEELFTALLPHLTQADEMKLILYCLWRMARQSSTFPHLNWEEVRQDTFLLESMVEQPDQPQYALEKALQLAVAHNALLVAESASQRIILLNSPGGRAALEAIHQGQWQPDEQPELPAEYSRQRPNIFSLYETHIGPLTPMIAETLQDAETLYPDQWITEAIDIAVKANKRSWRYIEAILRRWQEGGRDERRDRPDTQTDYQKYTDGEFSDYIER